MAESRRIAGRGHEGPSDLDAVGAAPKQHTVLLENEQVRVLDTRIAPGERTPLHTHAWPGVLYIRSWSDFVRRDADGQVLVDSRSMAAPPMIGWMIDGRRWTIWMSQSNGMPKSWPPT